VPVCNLTKSFVNDVSESGNYFDEAEKGFYLYVSPSAKIYRVRAKLRGTQDAVTVVIGRANEITLTMAKSEAKRAKGLIAQGIDPNQQVKAKARDTKIESAKAKQEDIKKSLTLRRLFEEYLDAKPLAQSTRKTYRYEIESKLDDWLDLPAVSITPLMVQDRYLEIAKNKPGSAGQVHRCLKAIYTFAQDRYSDESGTSPISRNPAKTIDRNKLVVKLAPRETPINPTDLPAWYSAVERCSDSDIRDYLLLLFFTGARMSAIAGLAWSSVDFSKRTIEIRDGKQKEARRHKYQIPMTTQMQAILQGRKAKSGADTLVFPLLYDGARAKRGIYVHVSAIKEYSGVNWHVHGLRKTFTSEASKITADYVLKALINHSASGDVTANNYIKYDIDALREPMQAINDRLTTLCRA